jgi:hypothetical protein
MMRPTRSNQIAKLKRRRDQLLSRACTRAERAKLLAEVRAINRKIWHLEGLRSSDA